MEKAGKEHESEKRANIQKENYSKERIMETGEPGWHKDRKMGEKSSEIKSSQENRRQPRINATEAKYLNKQGMVENIKIYSNVIENEHQAKAIKYG